MTVASGDIDCSIGIGNQNSRYQNPPDAAQQMQATGHIMGDWWVGYREHACPALPIGGVSLVLGDIGRDRIGCDL